MCSRLVPDEKDDLNKFADEIFGSHDKSEPTGDTPGEATSAHQKRVSRIVDKDKWIQATNKLKAEYRRVARQPYEEGEYASQRGLFDAIRGGKVFIFRAGNDLRAIAFISLACAAIFFAISLSGLLPGTEESILFFIVCFIPILLIGVVSLIKTMMSLLVVGPKGIVWRGGGILWGDVKSMNTSGKTVNTRSGRRQKYALRFELWDGTSRHIALHHRTNEAPVTPPNEFISQVVKAMYDVYGTTFSME